jgi:hypothetical protein
LAKLLGSTVDISPLLRFHFLERDFSERVYYHQSEVSFPSDSKGLGHIVGISAHHGQAPTYKVLTADTEHVIYHSLILPVTTDDANLRAGMFVGDPDTHNEIVKSTNDFSNVKNMDESNLADTSLPPAVFNPQDLLDNPF